MWKRNKNLLRGGGHSVMSHFKKTSIPMILKRIFTYVQFLLFLID